MTPEDKAKYNYRFGGYQFNTIQLDATGSQYVVMGVHPYYINQPRCWQNSALSHSDGVITRAEERMYPFLQNNENT